MGTMETVPSEEVLYRRQLLEALEGHDPLEVATSNVLDLERIVTHAEPERFGVPPRAGEWSPLQVLQHLADAEMVRAVRLRMMLTQDRPLLIGYDQEAWVSRFGELESPEAALARLRVLRRSNLALFASLTGAEWDRVAPHPERGDLSVRLLALMMAGHDLIHIRQMRAALEGLVLQKVSPAAR
jgi:hypothetical protein